MSRRAAADRKRCSADSRISVSSPRRKAAETTTERRPRGAFIAEKEWFRRRYFPPERSQCAQGSVPPPRDPPPTPAAEGVGGRSDPLANPSGGRGRPPSTRLYAHHRGGQPLRAAASPAHARVYLSAHDRRPARGEARRRIERAREQLDDGARAQHEAACGDAIDSAAPIDRRLPPLAAPRCSSNSSM